MSSRWLSVRVPIETHFLNEFVIFANKLSEKHFEETESQESLISEIRLNFLVKMFADINTICVMTTKSNCYASLTMPPTD